MTIAERQQAGFRVGEMVAVRTLNEVGTLSEVRHAILPRLASGPLRVGMDASAETFSVASGAVQA